MRKIMILEEQDFYGEPGDMESLKSGKADWEKQVDDIFLIQPYNTIQCLKSRKEYKGGCSVADFVKYLLP
ncbi:MAG: hypothetical protein PQJ58_20580 [Spirochaetales bacterium]|nr:hypothetical protein [Spirochaetales bacterium]